MDITPIAVTLKPLLWMHSLRLLCRILYYHHRVDVCQTCVDNIAEQDDEYQSLGPPWIASQVKRDQLEISVLDPWPLTSGTSFLDPEGPSYVEVERPPYAEPQASLYIDPANLMFADAANPPTSTYSLSDFTTPGCSERCLLDPSSPLDPFLLEFSYVISECGNPLGLSSDPKEPPLHFPSSPRFSSVQLNDIPSPSSQLPSQLPLPPAVRYPCSYDYCSSTFGSLRKLE